MGNFTPIRTGKKRFGYMPVKVVKEAPATKIAVSIPEIKATVYINIGDDPEAARQKYLKQHQEQLKSCKWAGWESQKRKG